MTSLLSLCLLLSLAAQTEAPIPTDIELAVGQQRQLAIPRIERIAIGNVDVADLKTSGADEVTLIGTGEGETTLRVWQKGTSARLEIKVRVGPGLARPTAVRSQVPAAKAQTVDEELTLAPGEERLVSFPGLTRVAIRDPDVLTVKPAGNDALSLKAGKAIGETTLIVWSGETRKAILVHVVK